MIATKWPGYNTPTRTLRCITAVHGFKFARFEYTDSNVQKTSFPFGCPYKRCAQPQDSTKILARPATKGWLGRRKGTDLFSISKLFVKEKTKKGAKKAGRQQKLHCQFRMSKVKAA